MGGIGQWIEQIPCLLFFTLAVALGWLLLALYVASDRGAGLIALLWLLSSMGLAGLWAVLLCGTWGPYSTVHSARLNKKLSVLSPVPLMVVLVVLWSLDVPSEARWQLSKSGLYTQVREYKAANVESIESGLFGWRWGGLYWIEAIYQRENCVFLQTNNHLDYYGGFAYCESENFSPRLASQLEHIEGDWWKFDVYH